MNGVQMHLALTHVPVILIFVGLTILVVGLFTKNRTLIKASYTAVLVAGISAVPVFFSGEEAEEAVEHLPGVLEALIERHEEIAKVAMFSTMAAALVAFAALVALKRNAATKFFRAAVLLLVIGASGVMVQTAHLGGLIRHSELRPDAAASLSSETGPENED